jgi:hypothetical protein
MASQFTILMGFIVESSRSCGARAAEAGKVPADISLRHLHGGPNLNG